MNASSPCGFGGVGEKQMAPSTSGSFGCWRPRQLALIVLCPQMKQNDLRCCFHDWDCEAETVTQSWTPQRTVQLLLDGVFFSLVAAFQQGAGPESGYAEATGTPLLFRPPKDDSLDLDFRVEQTLNDNITKLLKLEGKKGKNTYKKKEWPY